MMLTVVGFQWSAVGGRWSAMTAQRRLAAILPVTGW